VESEERAGAGLARVSLARLALAGGWTLTGFPSLLCMTLSLSATPLPSPHCFDADATHFPELDCHDRTVTIHLSTAYANTTAVTPMFYASMVASPSTAALSA
jgi:hypothetical protein